MSARFITISIMLSMGFVNTPRIAEGAEGIYAQICGTGQVLFISLGESENPGPEKAHLTACHAICTNEDSDWEEDEV